MDDIDMKCRKQTELTDLSIFNKNFNCDRQKIGKINNDNKFITTLH